jgi:hypothetical protein
MRLFSIVITVAGLVAALVPAPVNAQMKSALTPEELTVLAADLGAVLRFRQLGDTTTLARGSVDVGVEFGTAPIEAKGAWNVTRFVARFGVSDRVDIGAWGGQNSAVNGGMGGMDVKIALFRQGPRMPVALSVRPSFSSLIGASDIWAATTGVDLTVSRAFGAIAVYGGVAATSSIATERIVDVDFERTSVGATLSYAGASYTWRSLVAAVEVEHGTRTSYAVRIGRRF